MSKVFNLKNIVLHSKAAEASAPRPNDAALPVSERVSSTIARENTNTVVAPNTKSQNTAINGLRALGSVSAAIEKMRPILENMGVKQSHIQIALRRANETGESLARIMRDFGFLSGERVAEAVSLFNSIEYFPFESVEKIDKEHLTNLTMTSFKRFVPVGRDPDGKIILAVPDAALVNDAQNTFYEEKTRVVIASEHTIQSVYRKYFANTEKAFDDAVHKFMDSLETGRKKDEDDFTSGYVRDIFFSLLRHICYTGASDLYLYKSEYVGIVKLKINGVGSIFRTINTVLYDRLLNKLVQENTKAESLRLEPKESVVEFGEEDKKLHADISERFGFRLELAESRGIRTAVIRVLDKSSSATELTKLSFDSRTLKTIQRISRTSTGFFLVTGPTGSGKTTTMYATLKSIDPVERSIQSIENPIEYTHGLWQQYELRKDSTNEGDEYNKWLKALLRNAPDVILVGEVRDKEVAAICLNAANTGHLVFASLHTNNAALALARLKSLQVDIDVLGSVLLGILAQRLLRLLCSHCKVIDDSYDTVEALKEPYLKNARHTTFKAGAGCTKCDYTGYRGRQMIYELLETNPAVREAIETGQPPSVIAKAGLKDEDTMWANGLRIVSKGLTSFEELQRIANKE